MIKNFLLSAILLVITFTEACAEQKPWIVITDSWVRPTMGSKRSTAAYMNITNSSEKADFLYKVTSAQAAKTELHKIVSDDKGVDHMVHIDKLVIPAQQTVKLTTKGLHIMLFQLERVLFVGDKIELTLYFEKAGQIKLIVPVTKLKAQKNAK